MRKFLMTLTVVAGAAIAFASPSEAVQPASASLLPVVTNAPTVQTVQYRRHYHRRYHHRRYYRR